jgi:hypothetical protein
MRLQGPRWIRIPEFIGSCMGNIQPESCSNSSSLLRSKIALNLRRVKALDKTSLAIFWSNLQQKSSQRICIFD